MRSLAVDARVGFRVLARRWHRIEFATRARVEFVAVASLFPLSAAIAAIAAAPAALDLDGLEQRPIVQTVATPSIVEQVEELLQRQDTFVREARVERGDTLATLLERLDVRDHAALAFLRSDPGARPLVRLAPGRFMQANATADGALNWLKVYLGGDADAMPGTTRILTVQRAVGGFQVSEADIALERRIELRSGEVRVSLFGATDEAGVPDSVAQQMVDALESEVDFHRDLRRGDSFRVIYEALYASGEYVRPGRLLAVEFVNAGQRVDAYWHDDGSNNGSFYALDGRSTKRGFLRSPLEYTRVSSGFSASRAHPVFGYDAAHRGVDYAAPMGTKIRSVAAGSVQFAGWMNGYGNVVEIQHDGKHSTVYAHLQQIGPGMRTGARVGQGDLVGSVGMTGWTTGPHLHFELKKNGAQVNPMTASLPGAEPLPIAQLTAFREAALPLREQLALLERVTVAQSTAR
ncbi:MAG TPA: M23 family metallopeptidase [Burkholderiaceae bacterium]|nr:M23 family metallopeptidase [Burkholderiaceae bacterium]